MINFENNWDKLQQIVLLLVYDLMTNKSISYILLQIILYH